MEGKSEEKEAPVPFPEIATEIDAMAAVDQDMRKRSQTENYWDVSVDAGNTARMKDIVTQIGWPTCSRVGEEAASHAWLLVQHADRDVEFQEHCLALMKQEPPGEVLPRDMAMLEDRIRVNRNQPQLYGTQFRSVDGKPTLLPIEDEAHVDERRKQVGLGSLEEGIAEMYEDPDE
jgi:hypothetical protein